MKTRNKLLIVIALFGLASCKKTDDYYQKLRLEPELQGVRVYDDVYGLGDTITMYGRFVSDNLRVRIGDADAEIIEKRNFERSPYIYNNDSTQLIKMIITQAMGLGENRPISITAEGITIKGSSIEIVADSKSSVLKTGLTVQRIASYPTGFSPVYCRSGNGNMYFMNTTTGILIKINSSGIRTQLPFSLASLKDNNGAAFSLTRFNGYGIDPQERYLYLSLYEEAPAGTLLHYYRLCRYDLQNSDFTVLNKTPYHTDRNLNTAAALQPFEGKIQDIKMFTATGIFPGKNGTIYFNMDNRMITRLDATGSYNYRFKNNRGFSQLIDVAPEIYDAVANTYKSYHSLWNMLPGTEIFYKSVAALDPEKEYLYVKNGEIFTNGSPDDVQTQQYDLPKQEAGGIFNKVMVRNGTTKPYSVGSFRVLNYSSGINGAFGFMPLQNGDLAVLKYQDLFNNETYKGFDLPQWTTLDFKNQQGKFYAPGIFDRKGYTMSAENDILLNYDAQGMLYMTGNNKGAILKTVYK